MYSVLKAMPAHDATRVALTFGLSLVIAELLYAFHSFSLECLAFVGTWFMLDKLAHVFVRRTGRRAARQHR